MQSKYSVKGMTSALAEYHMLGLELAPCSSCMDNRFVPGTNRTCV